MDIFILIKVNRLNVSSSKTNLHLVLHYLYLITNCTITILLPLSSTLIVMNIITLLGCVCFFSLQWASAIELAVCASVCVAVCMCACMCVLK